MSWAEIIVCVCECEDQVVGKHLCGPRAIETTMLLGLKEEDLGKEDWEESF